MFWKAHWWAKLNEHEKDAIIQYESKWDEKVLVDYAKPPPRLNDGRNETEDKRGTRIRFKSGDVGIVTGFHDEVRKPRISSRSRESTWIYAGKVYQSKAAYNYVFKRTWWVLVNGEMELINMKTRSSRRSWREI